jgi:hypothetical protein
MTKSINFIVSGLDNVQAERYQSFPTKTLNSFAERSLTMNLPKNLGILLLGIWLIIHGLMQLLSISFSGLGVLMAIFAVIIGILLIMKR